MLETAKIQKILISLPSGVGIVCLFDHFVLKSLQKKDRHKASEDVSQRICSTHAAARRKTSTAKSSGMVNHYCRKG